MKARLLRLGLGLAVVALAVLWWQFGDDVRRPDREEETASGTEENRAPDEAPKSRFGTPAKTRTPLEKHLALRELERTIEEGNEQGALVYRQMVAEDLPRLLKDEELTDNLLDLIEEKGFGSDVAWQRDVLIPLLRAIPHEEATRMIRNGYYAAEDDDERQVLLEAMARQYHDPEEASVWAVDVALNSNNPEMREFAFTAIELHSGDQDLIARTAIAIFESTTRREQAQWMLHEASRRAGSSPSAIKWIRERLQTPRTEELHTLLIKIDGWGTTEDAARLEVLAAEFPEHSFGLREKAIGIRRRLKDPNAERDLETLERERMENEKKMAAQRAEQQRREEEAKKRLAEQANDGG